jgi:PAS domain S-box-containing protein
MQISHRFEQFFANLNVFIAEFLSPIALNKLLHHFFTQKTVIRLSFILKLYLMLFFAQAVVNYSQNLVFSFFISVLTFTLLLCQWIFFKTRLESIQKNLFIATIYISLLIQNFSKGNIAGEYLFFFLFIITTIYLMDFKNKTQLFASFVFGMIIMLLALYLSPLHSAVQIIITPVEEWFFKMNLIVSSLLSSILAILIIKDNFFKEKEINDSQQFLTSIFNTSLDALFLVNESDLLITRCNTQSITMIGAEGKDDVYGKNMLSFLSKENEVLFKKVASVLQQPDASWQGEINCLKFDGSYFPGYLSIISLTYGDASYKKVNVIDASDIKQVQLQLTEAKEKAENATKVKSEFVSNMSHELRTPLNGIIGSTQLLLQEDILPSQKEKFEMLKYSSEHMLTMVNSILDLSKIEAGKMELSLSTENMAMFVKRICKPFEEQIKTKGLGLRIDIDEQLNGDFSTDFTKLNQILSNLLSNAIKFTAFGEIRLVAILNQSFNDVAGIHFSIADTGIGIAPEKQHLVFESFRQADSKTTRRFGGTGLGLSISKHLVNLLQGEITLKSEIGKGSEFEFEIKAKMKHAKDAKVGAAKDAVYTFSNFTGLHVLIAEDNLVNMLIITKFLQKWDVQFTKAGNGAEALSKINEQQFDILLIDLEMPEVDGFGVAKEVRQTNLAIPMIACTATLYEGIQEDLMQKGFTNYLQKPFMPEQLHAILAKYFVAKEKAV